MRCSSLYNISNYQKNKLSKAIDNYQKIFGIKCGVYRYNKSESNDLFIAYGYSKNYMKNDAKYVLVGEVSLLVNPIVMYKAYTGGATQEIEVHCSTDFLEVGDRIKYTWSDGSTLEFQVSAVPDTYSDIYFTYKLRGVFSTKSEGPVTPTRSTSIEESKKSSNLPTFTRIK